MFYGTRTKTNDKFEYFSNSEWAKLTSREMTPVPWENFSIRQILFRRERNMYLDLNLSALPVFFALWTLIGWLLCYAVAVLTGNYCTVPRQSSSHYFSGHIDPLLPLISMCGAQWPESSLFSLFMNMSAVMSAFLSYFRFRQVIYSYQIMKI